MPLSKVFCIILKESKVFNFFKRIKFSDFDIYVVCHKNCIVFLCHFSDSVKMLQLNSVSKLISYLKDSSDDSTDRMHYVFTSTFLLFLAGLIGSSQTFGSPIHCMVPANFPCKFLRICIVL